MSAKVMAYLATLDLKVKSFFEDEKGAVDMVAIIVLIGIVVLLAVVFKDNLKDLIDTLFGSITGKATDVVTNDIT